MSHTDAYTCLTCGRTQAVGAHFCPACGAALAPAAPAHDIVVVPGQRLFQTDDTLSMPGLQALVEASVAWWQQAHMQNGALVTNTEAAEAMQSLSRILQSLAQQMQAGRETVRITARLPSLRRYTVGCPACGAGNRAGAQFCQNCGARLPATPPVAPASTRLPLLHTALHSDVGRVRTQNEDVCLVDTLPTRSGATVTLLLVADGMGGMQRGATASHLASETVYQQLAQQLAQQHPTTDAAWHSLLTSAVQTANAHVHRNAQEAGVPGAMGTTLTLLLIDGARAHLAHVGDSRAYLLHADGVAEDGTRWLQLTSDHSLVARLVDIGHITPAEARTHPQRTIIYRALGTAATVDVDCASQPLGLGDVLLLCSDGLTNYLTADELTHVVLAAATLDEASERLIRLANERGGADNSSVVLAQVQEQLGGAM